MYLLLHDDSTSSLHYLVPVTKKMGFTVSTHRLNTIALLTLVLATPKYGKSPTYTLNGDAHQVIFEIRAPQTTACRHDFDESSTRFMRPPDQSPIVPLWVLFMSSPSSSQCRHHSFDRLYGGLYSHIHPCALFL